MAARDFVVEQNLVVCEKHVNDNNTRRGIFSGDAGATSSFCDGDCSNVGGLYRNNIVMACNGNGNSGGLFLGNEIETTYTHHTVHNVKRNFLNDYDDSIDVSVFASFLARDFVLAGDEVLTADAANIRQDAAAQVVFVNADTGNFARTALTLTDATVPRRDDTPRDFCGHERGAITDIGAIDYSHVDADECVATIQALYDEL
jgi:hypothetical protein